MLKEMLPRLKAQIDAQIEDEIKVQLEGNHSTNNHR
jgi:hypothetical protein